MTSQMVNQSSIQDLKILVLYCRLFLSYWSRDTCAFFSASRGSYFITSVSWVLINQWTSVHPRRTTIFGPSQNLGPLVIFSRGIGWCKSFYNKTVRIFKAQQLPAIHLLLRGAPIDYRYADARWSICDVANDMTVLNLDCLSSSETRVGPGLRRWKWHKSDSTWCQESVGGIWCTKKWKQLLYDPFRIWQC